MRAKAFAAGFSGLYLALNLVLWCLMLRGLSIAVRTRLDNPLWRSFWDAIFAVSSLLLALIFGVALGNVIRGVPLSPDGQFFAALWTTFTPGVQPGILDWFTVLVGALAVAILAVHGANYLTIKTDGAVDSRARRIAGIGEWVVLPILHLNGYKIANPTVLARISRSELVLDCKNTRYVIPAVFKRESIDSSGYPLSRV